MPTVWSDLEHVSRCTRRSFSSCQASCVRRHKHATANTDDAFPASHASAHETTQPAMRRLIRSAESAERARRPGRSCLEWLKMATWQAERNGQALVRYTDCHRKAFKPLPDNSPLGQIVADRAIRLVVAAFSGSGCYRNRLLAGKRTAFAVPPAALPGMMNAEEFVQFAPKSDIAPECRRGPSTEPNWPDDATRRLPPGGMPQKYTFKYLLSEGVFRLSS